LTIKVHLLDIEKKALPEKPAISLKPLDLAWINDPTLYGKIETAIHQLPCFVGSFYRDWMDKRCGLDMAHLITELKLSTKETTEKNTK
jgi:hypothetical protein